MKNSLTLVALLTACAAVTGCGGVAGDDIGSDQAALTGVEPDEIDCTATAEYDARGVTTSTTSSPPAPTGEPTVETDESGCDTTYVPGANGGIWKTTNATAAGTGGAKGLVTYGPVITVKPKG